MSTHSTTAFFIGPFDLEADREREGAADHNLPRVPDTSTMPAIESLLNVSASVGLKLTREGLVGN